MIRKLLFSGGIFVLLVVVIATPISVRAEGDPPSTPEPVRPPWITGKNPQVSLASYEEENLSITGSVLQAQGVAVPLMDPPSYIDLEPQKAAESLSGGISLAVPQHFQNPKDVTCGAAALGMALEFLSSTGESDPPSQESLVGYLKNTGLLYEGGTGVEELAFLARQHGYLGSSAFHDWTLEKLAGELAAGQPVVVSLGANGADRPGHYVTLTGIAKDGSWVRYNDPILGEQTSTAADFLDRWNAQGSSGLTVTKEALAKSSDPMLPWMGLFSALTMLAVVAKYYPLGEEINGVVRDIRGILSDPSRKGFGGKLDPGGIGGSSSPPYPAPDGFTWIQKSVPKYGWKDITATYSRQVPIFEKRKVQVDTRVWYEKVPRYRTVRVDRGRWVNKKVTLYRRQKYVRYYKTTRVRKTHWVRRGWRFVPKTYYVTKKTPVYGYKNVPYRTYYKKEWESKWVTEKVFDAYTKVRHEEPVYEYLMMPTGKTKTEYYPKTEKRYAQIGTELEWQLKKESTSNQDKKPTIKIPPGYTEEQWNSLPYNLQTQILKANEAEEEQEVDAEQQPNTSSGEEDSSISDPGAPVDIFDPQSVNPVMWNLFIEEIQNAFLKEFQERQLNALRASNVEPECPVDVPQWEWDFMDLEQKQRLALAGPTEMSAEGLLNLMWKETGPDWDHLIDEYGLHDDGLGNITGGIGELICGPGNTPEAQARIDQFKEEINEELKKLGGETDFQDLINVLAKRYVDKVLPQYEDAVSTDFSGTYLTTNQYDALVLFGYNKGANTYTGKGAQIAQLIQEGNLAKAAAYMTSFDTKGEGHEALQYRHLQTAILLLDGIYVAGEGADEGGKNPRPQDLINTYLKDNEEFMYWYELWH